MSAVVNATRIAGRCSHRGLCLHERKYVLDADLGSKLKALGDERHRLVRPSGDRSPVCSAAVRLDELWPRLVFEDGDPLVSELSGLVHPTLRPHALRQAPHRHRRCPGVVRSEDRDRGFERRPRLGELATLAQDGPEPGKHVRSRLLISLGELERSAEVRLRGRGVELGGAIACEQEDAKEVLLDDRS